MPDKLTDREIVKALQEMADYPHNYEEGQDLQNALDLIDRLQATIEDLNIRLSEERNRTDYISKSYNEIKAEAYKEFAELLCKIWQGYEDENISGIYVPKWIMLVYKKLVGEDNES